MPSISSSPKRILWLMVGLLLLHFFIRSHHILRLDAFVDEGYHLTRAAIVWDFDTHPARFANGKFLLYFWLGLFETDSQSALPIGRLAIGLFSLLSGAMMYRLGRDLHTHATGLWAMALYGVLPFTFFFERMALADPFASVFALLTAWQSLRLAKHPTVVNGLWLGLWLALATLAKLTMGLLPLLPVATCLLLYGWSGQWKADVYAGVQRYYLPLQAAAFVVILCWLPILIPAALAIGSDHPFTLVNAENLQYVNQIEPIQELSEVIPNALAYWGMLLVGLLGIIPLVILSSNAHVKRHGAILVAWMLCIIVLPLIAASEIRSRYLMPLAPPCILLLAYSLTLLQARYRWGYRVVVVGLGIWAITFALPFACYLMTTPQDVPLATGDKVRYLSGNFTGPAVQQAGLALNDLPNETIYATWGTCQTLYFYSEQSVTCLNPPNNDQLPSDDLALRLPMVFESQESVLVVLNEIGGMPFDIEGTSWEVVKRFPRISIDRPVTIWRVSPQ